MQVDGRGRGDARRLRRLVVAGAVRARGGGRGAARRRPPRRCSGTNEPRVVDARVKAAAPGALRRRHHARRVPPRARRAPRDRQQRAARPRARRRGRGAVRGDRRRRALAAPATLDALPRARARADRPRAARRSRTGPSRRPGRDRLRAAAAATSSTRPREGYDLFLTGEPAEPSCTSPRELGITLRRRRALRDRAPRRAGADGAARRALRARVGVRRAAEPRVATACRASGTAEYAERLMMRPEAAGPLISRDTHRKASIEPVARVARSGLFSFQRRNSVMANHLTPEELSKELGIDRHEVIRVCVAGGRADLPGQDRQDALPGAAPGDRRRSRSRSELARPARAG